ncbi:MAG: hypothetical protein HZB82_08835 [Deltaproteobacteria bacterium]|nr:hypothetical protein [Deltaproteobacteria bacterium]
MERKADYKSLIIVWAGLILLTWLSAGVSGAGLAAEARVAVPLLIAMLKASLVFYFFMRFRVGGEIFWVVLPAGLITVIIITLLVFSDVGYRY